jgi:hypothetical protein
MAPTRALINSSQHPQHASTGINSSVLKKKVQKTPKVPIKGGTKIEGRGGRKNVLKRTKTNARTAQTNVSLNAKYLNFPIRCKTL